MNQATFAEAMWISIYSLEVYLGLVFMNLRLSLRVFLLLLLLRMPRYWICRLIRIWNVICFLDIWNNVNEEMIKFEDGLLSFLLFFSLAVQATFCRQLECLRREIVLKEEAKKKNWKQPREYTIWILKILQYYMLFLLMRVAIFIFEIWIYLNLNFGVVIWL